MTDNAYNITIKLTQHGKCFCKLSCTKTKKKVSEKHKFQRQAAKRKNSLK